MKKEVNLLLDTSGSFITSNFDKVIDYIFDTEKVEKINVIQFDTDVKHTDELTKENRELEKIYGGGGSCLQSASNFLSNSSWKENDSFIFTDGFIDNASFENYHKNITYLKPKNEVTEELNLKLSNKTTFKTIEL